MKWSQRSFYYIEVQSELRSKMLRRRVCQFLLFDEQKLKVAYLLKFWQNKESLDFSSMFYGANDEDTYEHLSNQFT